MSHGGGGGGWGGGSDRGKRGGTQVLKLYRLVRWDRTWLSRCSAHSKGYPCHQFLPINRYNRYQWNHIHRFLSIYQGQYRPITRLINRYRFLSIDYPRWIDLALARKPYQIALLFTHKKGDFGPISVTERRCAAPKLKKDRHISESFRSHSLVLCEHVSILYQILAFLVDMKSNPLTL